MDGNLGLWTAAGVAAILFVLMALVARALRKIYYRTISFRETLYGGLAETRSAAEAAGERMGALEARVRDALSGIISGLRSVETALGKLEDSVGSARADTDRMLGELRGETESAAGKLEELRGETESAAGKLEELVCQEKELACCEQELAGRIAELRADLSARAARLEEEVAGARAAADGASGAVDGVSSRVLALERSVDGVSSRALALEGSVDGLSKRLADVRYNDFVEYSLRLVEEAHSAGSIEEGLYDRLRELLHSAKVDHFGKTAGDGKQ